VKEIEIARCITDRGWLICSCSGAVDNEWTTHGQEEERLDADDEAAAAAAAWDMKDVDSKLIILSMREECRVHEAAEACSRFGLIT